MLVIIILKNITQTEKYIFEMRVFRKSKCDCRKVRVDNDIAYKEMFVTLATVCSYRSAK